MRKLSGSATQQFFQQVDRFRLAVVLEMNFRQLQEERTSLAHHALLHVKISKFFERANLFGSQLGDALVNGDGLGEKSVGHKNLREPLEIIDGLKSFALANVEFADGHQGDLVARFILQNLLVFGDGLGDFALVQELLGGFDEFAFVISHALTGTVRVAWPRAGWDSPLDCARTLSETSPDCVATRCRVHGATLLR